MVKKVLFLVLAIIFFLIPFHKEKASAATEYAIWKSDFEYTPSNYLINPELIFDNDYTTRGQIGYSKQITIYFKEPTVLKGIDTISTGLNVRIYGASGVLGSFNTSYSNGTTPIFTPLNYSEPVTKVEIYNSSGNTEYVKHWGFLKESKYEEVNGLNSIATDEAVNLSWNNPIEKKLFAGTQVFRNGVLIKSFDKTVSSFKDNEVKPNTVYDYIVKATYEDGFITKGVTKRVTTNEKLELKELKGVALSFNSGSFTWKNPNNPLFKKVNIYKDGEKIGETISDNYKVSNLKGGTNYTFSFKIEDVDGKEREAQELNIKTPVEPPPEIEDPTFETDENGDYIVKWETPTEGKMKVFVGGVLYKTVPASDKSITIPKSDLKYTVLGDPDVTLQPVSESGIPGEIIGEESKTKPPFSVIDLIESGNGLLWYIAPLLLLALSFLLFPKLRNLILGSFRISKEEQRETRNRFRTETQTKDLQDQKMKNRMDKERLERKKRQEIRSMHQGKEQLEKLEQRERKRREARQLREPRVKVRTPREPRRRGTK